MPGVAREIKINEENFHLEKIIVFFSLCYSRDTHGFPQKMSAKLVQQFGQL